MKKWFMACLAVVLSFTIGCEEAEKKEKTALETVNEWISHVEALAEKDTLKKYKDSNDPVGATKELAGDFFKADLEDSYVRGFIFEVYGVIDSGKKIKATKSKEVEDVALVTVEVTNESDTSTVDVVCRKVDGTWKISLNENLTKVKKEIARKLEKSTEKDPESFDELERQLDAVMDAAALEFEADMEEAEREFEASMQELENEMNSYDNYDSYDSYDVPDYDYSY